MHRNDLDILIVQLPLYRREQIKWRTKEALRTLLTEVPAQQTEILVDELVAHGMTSTQMNSLTTSVMQMSEKHLESMKRMVTLGFKAEQVHLFVISNPTERDQLSDKWRRRLDQWDYSSYMIFSYIFVYFIRKPRKYF